LIIFKLHTVASCMYVKSVVYLYTNNEVNLCVTNVRITVYNHCFPYALCRGQSFAYMAKRLWFSLCSGE